MANTTLKTRILLRNDTLANWQNSELSLAKGEVAIATGLDGNLAEVRVGTGNSTWANALKLHVEAGQISGIIETIRGTAKQYQVVANGEDGNSWKLQEAALSGGAWTDVAGSTWTVDFTALNSAIDYLSGQIDTTNATLNTVSSDYLKASVFNTLSNEIGLSAASSANPVVTLDDIKDLAGAMHFRGAVTRQEGETDLEALARVITDPKAGDVAIITDNSKEYVYNGTTWIELGDEVLYATKAEVNAVSTDLQNKIDGLTSDVDYLSGQVDEANTLIATTSALTLTAAKDYTDTKVEDLSNSLSNYYTKAETDAISTALSTDYVNKIDDAKSEVIGQSTDLSSADTVYGAKAYAKDYADEKMDELSSGFLILNGGTSQLREGEPEAGDITA